MLCTSGPCSLIPSYGLAIQPPLCSLTCLTLPARLSAGLPVIGLSLSVSVCLSLSACLPAYWLFAHLPACPACLSDCRPSYLPMCWPACQSACQPACLSAGLPVGWPACLPACTQACPPTCLSVSLPASLPANPPVSRSACQLSPWLAAACCPLACSCLPVCPLA